MPTTPEDLPRDPNTEEDYCNKCGTLLRYDGVCENPDCTTNRSSSDVADIIPHQHITGKELEQRCEEEMYP